MESNAAFLRQCPHLRGVCLHLYELCKGVFEQLFALFTPFPARYGIASREQIGGFTDRCPHLHRASIGCRTHESVLEHHLRYELISHGNLQIRHTVNKMNVTVRHLMHILIGKNKG